MRGEVEEPCGEHLAARAGAGVIAVTTSSSERGERLRAFGATHVLDRSGAGNMDAPAEFDVILDIVGAKYLSRNIAALATSGRLVIIGMQGGTRGELDIAALLAKRGAVIATSLRARPAAEKATIVAAVREHVWPLVAQGRIRPIVHTTLPLDQVAEAHQLMEDSGHVGKIVLTP